MTSPKISKTAKEVIDRLTGKDRYANITFTMTPAAVPCLLEVVLSPLTAEGGNYRFQQKVITTGDPQHVVFPVTVKTGTYKVDLNIFCETHAQATSLIGSFEMDRKIAIP